MLSLFISEGLPDAFKVNNGSELHLNFPVSINKTIKPNNFRYVSESATSNTSLMELKLFGVIPIKNVTVQSVEPKNVFIGGDAFGIKVYTDGVIVVSLSSVETSDGSINPAEKSGIKVGDVILAVNGQSVYTNKELAEIITKCKGKTLEFTVRRDSTVFDVKFTPAKSKTDGKYKAGIWIRDSTAGIGTITFVDPLNGFYGGLGHAICDVDTEETMPILSGEILDAHIYDVIPSCKGKPGEVKGVFSNNVLGSVLLNCDCGVFGSCDFDTANETPTEILLPQDIRCEEAEIICEVSGSKKSYKCVIEKVNLKKGNGLRDMVIKVTDPSLLKITGGIVQGMSGSPIIQKGKLAGAITHVIVDNPTKGYAVFADTMYQTAQNCVTENELDKAS